MKNESKVFFALIMAVIAFSIAPLLITIEIIKREIQFTTAEMYPDFLYLFLFIGLILEIVIVPTLVTSTIYLFRTKKFLTKKQRIGYLSSVILHFLILLPLIHRMINPFVVD